MSRIGTILCKASYDGITNLLEDPSANLSRGETIDLLVIRNDVLELLGDRPDQPDFLVQKQ
jgi:hypothetical protein